MLTTYKYIEMIKRLFTLALWVILGGVSAQQVSIDIITYGNEENIEYQLDKITDTFLAEYTGDCVYYNKVNNLESANSSVVLELWDSEEMLNQYIFKERRSRKVKDKEGNTTTKNFTATGLMVRSMYEIYGRLSEKADGNILKTFKIGGTYDYEYASDEIRAKYPIQNDEFRKNYREVNQMFVEKYSDKIEQKRLAALAEVDTSFKQMLLALPVELVKPARLTGIEKEKNGKLKKATYEKCAEAQMRGNGLLYLPIHTPEKIGEETAYRKVGSCYTVPDPGVIGIRGGEEELLPLIKSETELLIGRPTDMECAALSEYKDDQTTDLSFVFIYHPLNTYNDAEKKHIELMCQGSFLGYDDVKVVANDPIAEELNKTFAKSIYDRAKSESTQDESLLDNLTIDDFRSNGTIYIEVGNPKSSPLEGKTSFLGQKVDAPVGSRFIFVKFQYRKGDNIYEDIVQISGMERKIGLDLNTFSIDAPNVRTAIADTRIEILGIEEEKKDMVKKVIVAGNIPLDGGDKYTVYDKPDFGKKTKALAVLSIDDVLNTYVATAKVKEGDKTIKALLESGKELYVELENKSSSLLGKAVDAISGSSNLPRSTMFYMPAKGDKIAQ